MTTTVILPLAPDNYDRFVTDYSRTERLALCDLLDQVGPDHPTLCEGWTTHDLVVHLWVRESDPVAGPGILIPALSNTTARRSEEARAKWSYTELVDKVRHGPPTFSIYSFPVLGPSLNTLEYYVHHEDVRRARPAEPRDLPRDHQNVLWSRFVLTGRALLRKSPVGIVLRRPDGTTAVMKRPTSAGSVTVTGEPSELVLFGFGRGSVARVDLDGEPDAVTALRTAPFHL
jgi:uncharacterized protein (TIGR03085 family)